MLARLATIFALIAAATAAPAHGANPPVRHVFVVMLENRDFATSFGESTGPPYLAKTLRARGELLTQYYGVTHESLGNYIALISGQGSNVVTQADCPLYAPVIPGTIGVDGQAAGVGCVYPSAVKTVADQLDAAGLAWRGYMEDMRGTCQHPALGTPDTTQAATASSQYAARHNPFVYFDSLVSGGSCARNDVPLSRFTADLASEPTTPQLSFITPDLCHDGHDASCADGGPGGFTAVNQFLQSLVPKILASPAYQDRGLLIITFDESAHGADACCNEPQFPNTLNNGATSIGRGGGRVGALLLSPYIKRGSTNATPYNHFSLLRSVEDMFGLDHLGYAAQSGLRAFGPDVFNGPRCFNLPLPAPFGDGEYARGTLVAAAGVRGRTLTVRLAHDARLRITATSGRSSQRLSLTRGSACRSYRVRLPFAHGAVALRAAAGSGLERRSLRY
jgi:phospholipase C